MRYVNNQTFDAGRPDQTGILITNLGTPDAPETGALRRYLKEFLSDPRIVDLPRPLWWLILNLVILNIRPRRSAAAYRTVWTERGSPLMFNTHDQAQALQALMAERFGENVKVEFAMRYGNPSMSDGIQKLLDQGVARLLVLPLYPQYSGAANGSTFDALGQDMAKRRWLPELRFANQYFDNPAYIRAVADSIRQFQKKHGEPDKLLFSYHGIPKRYCDNGDPYPLECFATSKLIAEELGLQAAGFETIFQSRFGREEWLQPYADETLKKLPDQGTRSVQVVCPGFSADCLETLEEIGVENRDYFLEAGGEKYAFIPCLNSDEQHIQALAAIVEQHIGDWLQDD